MMKGKGLIRSNNRRGVESGKVAEIGPGLVHLYGPYVAAHEAEIRRRLENVAERATSPRAERGIVSIERDAEGLEIRTATQELAHRIVREMKKAFKGQTSFHWADGDGSLLATWRRDA